MKNILLAILIFFGLKTSAQVNYCDSVSYGISSTMNYPLILSGSIGFIPDTAVWTWIVCDQSTCYSSNMPSASFSQIPLTDTVKVCYDVVITMNNAIYVCSGCDSLTYNPNTYQWEKIIAQPLTIKEIKPNNIYSDKIYNILGVEIFNIPKGTIYIKNRKKYIK